MSPVSGGFREQSSREDDGSAAHAHGVLVEEARGRCLLAEGGKVVGDLG